MEKKKIPKEKIPKEKMPERIAKTKAKVERAKRKRNPVQVNREILGKMEIRREMGTLRMKMQIRGTVNPMRKTIPVRQIPVLRVEMQI